MKSASPWKLVSKKEAWIALKFPGRWLRWLWTSENTADQHQQMTWQPKSSLTVETYTGLQAAWILYLSSLPPDSGTLISKLNAKFTAKWPLSNSPVLFLLSPDDMLLTMFLFQKWLGSPFPEDVWARWLLMHWLQLQFTPFEALPSVWIGFAWQYSQACGFPCCVWKLFHHILHILDVPVYSNIVFFLFAFSKVCLFIYIYIYIFFLYISQKYIDIFPITKKAKTLNNKTSNTNKILSKTTNKKP